MLLPKRIIPDDGNPPPENLWPSLTIEALPEGEIKEVLRQVPEIAIDSRGYITAARNAVPFSETDWSKENRRIINPDSLVVHWNGHPHPEEATIQGIMAGYNEERTNRALGYDYITSAHVTIGPYSLTQEHASDRQSRLSILQTQKPEGGMPTVSSHLRPDLTAERESYHNARHPINAMQLLLPFYGLPRSYNFLPNVLKGSGEDLNLRTVSLELTGRDFDTPEGHPNAELMANTVGIIIAYINKYPDIKFANILGHFEIQEDKADPGKRFMAELRLLLALKVLTGQNRRLKENFFGPFADESGNLNEGVKRFFHFHWDYLVSSNWGHQKQVFDWEGQTGFWQIYNRLFEENPTPTAEHFVLPVSPHGNKQIIYGRGYADPEYHEGVDFNLQATRREVNEDLGEPIVSVASGKVVFAGEIPQRPGLGKTLVIEHFTPGGGKLLSLYAHLDQTRVEKGQKVEIRQQIATMGNSGAQEDSHLHFDLFPASSKREWELSLYLQLSYAGQRINPYLEDDSGRIYIVPQTVGRQFVEGYYFNPLSFIAENS